MIEYRTYIIDKAKDKRYYCIKPSKGKTPVELSGIFTSVAEAKNKIDSFIVLPNGRIE